MTSGMLRELTSDTLADQAYQAIYQAIAVGELQRGEKITERARPLILLSTGPVTKPPPR
jgi:DNA-binding GntR family transcriptional regulator